MSEVAIAVEDEDLPKGWSYSKIQEVAEINPRVDKKAIPDDLIVSFVPMPAVGAESGSIDVSEEKLFSDVKKGFTPFIEGDVLFAKITPCMENGKMAVVPKVKNDYGFGSTEFHVLRPTEKIEAKYLYYFVSSRTFRGYAQHNMTGAVGQKRVPTNYLKEQLIPVAPLEQQKRIVAKIEELFSHIDAGIDALNKAKQLLKQYRQSVLKAAVTGELTKEWREQNKDKLEPASQLLERILTERRQKWEEQQLEQFKAKGKIPKNDKWKEKYKEPTYKATKDGGLPGGWCWAALCEVAFIISGNTPKGIADKGNKGSIPWYKVGDMNTLGNEKYMSHSEVLLSDDDVSQLKLNIQPAGTIIFPKRGGAIATNKKRILAQDSAYDLNTMGINPNGLVLEFVWSWFLSIDLSSISDGSNVPQLNHKDIDPLNIPVPPKLEQVEIGRICEEKLDSIKRLVSDIDAQLKKAEKNKQSILASAFAGKLT